MIDIPTLVDNATFEEIFDVVALKARKGMTFVEGGSFLGGSICYLGQQLKNLNKDVNLIAVDNWKFSNISSGHMQLVHGTDYYQEFLKNVKSCELNIDSIVGDSIETAKTFEDNSVDFLFLDGNHDFPYVEDELREWLPKMKTNSIIAGHDYCSAAGIRMAVKNIFCDNVQFTKNQNSYYRIIGKGLDG